MGNSSIEADNLATEASDNAAEAVNEAAEAVNEAAEAPETDTPTSSGRAANDPREVRRRQREAELRAQGIK